MANTNTQNFIKENSVKTYPETSKIASNKHSTMTSNGPTTSESSHVNGKDTVVEKWGFHIDELYKIALTFFKAKDGTKALPTTYQEKLRLVALTKQVSFGPYKPELMPDVGFFDVVGNDRRLAWQKIGSISKEEAMLDFVNSLNSLCPLFSAHVEAHKTEKEEQERIRKEEELQKEQQELERLHLRDVTQHQDLEKNRQLSQEMLIRNALNQQTYVQFRQYAEQQYPGDSVQQEALIKQLQEQHFVQYMQQVYQQQQILQQQYLQQQSAASSAAASPARTAAGQNVGQVTAGGQNVGQVTAGGQNGGQVTAGAIANNLAAATSSASVVQNSTMVLSGDVGSLGPGPWKRGGSEERSSGGEEERTSGDGQPEDDPDASDLPPIAAASMWTRKDVSEFKDSLLKDQDAVIKVGSGELVTVRVPTHEDGSCLFWEFATDSYDIGFGVFFEWSVPSANELSVHVSESSEDEEEEGGKRRTDLPGDAKLNSENDPPTDEIIPVYRRDCQDEVYCGSHVYPGRGVYLLKFDNSYSLWRGKTVYYRVYYTR